MSRERTDWALLGAGLFAALLTWAFRGTPSAQERAMACRPQTDASCVLEPLPTWTPGADTVARVTPGTTWEPLDDSTFTRHRRAFGSRHAKGALPGQSPVKGFEQRLLNSFHGGDDAVGWLVSAPFSEARAVKGRVGGGDDCSKVFVGVLVDGAVSQRVCGQKTEVLRDFTVTVPAGGQLVIADFATGGWGHLLVSDLAVAR